MAVTADKSSPYGPIKAIIDLIERHRSRGLPSPVTADILGRAGISDSLIPRTLQALQTLDLIDEGGRPTPTFEGIRLAPETEYKKRLEDWLKAAYADVFSFVDPTVDDETKIRDAFRNYQPVGQQPRMVALFQGLCAAAGIIREKTQPAAARARPRTQSPPPRQRAQPEAAPSEPSKSHHHGHTSLPPALSGLLASLPTGAGGWTKAERDRFVTTFSAVLDFCYPISEPSAKMKENGELHSPPP